MNPLIHAYVDGERLLYNKVYHFRVADRFSRMPEGTESVFHIMKDFIHSRIFNVSSELSIYNDKFSIVVNREFAVEVIKIIKVSSNEVKLGPRHGDQQYIDFYDTPENFIPQLTELVEKIKELEQRLMV